MAIKEEQKFNNSNIFEGMSSISALIKSIDSKRNDRKIERILFDSSKTKSKYKELGFLKARANDLGYSLEMVSSDDIDKLTIGSTHGGIIAVCSERTIPILDESNIKNDGVYFILEGVEDPYNFGYAIRSLYAAGVDGIILDERNWMGAAGIVARSSAGASELIDMYISEPASAADIFKKLGYSVICAGIRDSESIFETSLKRPLLVILGGEKRGISRNLLNKADKIVRIDYGSSFGGSLSTSASAAVFAFEIFRYNR